MSTPKQCTGVSLLSSRVPYLLTRICSHPHNDAAHCVAWCLCPKVLVLALEHTIHCRDLVYTHTCDVRGTMAPHHDTTTPHIPTSRRQRSRAALKCCGVVCSSTLAVSANSGHTLEAGTHMVRSAFCTVPALTEQGACSFTCTASAPQLPLPATGQPPCSPSNAPEVAQKAWVRVGWSALSNNSNTSSASVIPELH